MTVNGEQQVFKSACDDLRERIKFAEVMTRGLTPSVSDLPEGVHFQEYGCQDGVSCYDKGGAG